MESYRVLTDHLGRLSRYHRVVVDSLGPTPKLHRRDKVADVTRASGPWIGLAPAMRGLKFTRTAEVEDCELCWRLVEGWTA
jgi:hypothetical protein